MYDMYNIVKIDGEYYQLVSPEEDIACSRCEMWSNLGNCVFNKHNPGLSEKAEWFDADLTPITKTQGLYCVRFLDHESPPAVMYYKFKKLNALELDLKLASKGGAYVRDS